MKILYAASEAQPFATSGGLADVAGSLPKALVKEGCECSVIMPFYKKTINAELQKKFEFVTQLSVPVGWRSKYCGVFKTIVSGVTYYLLDNEYYFDRDFGIYGYYDEAERYAFFSRAVLEAVKRLGELSGGESVPDIINSNDWQCALIPIYFNLYYRYQYDMRNIKNVFTIHNIAYQGRYGLNLLEEVFSIPLHMKPLVEYDDDVNLMKGAFEVADKITTVSETYSKEILDPWFSYGLDRALADKQYKTCGFLNGIDTVKFNPATDKAIAKNFSATKKAGKKACKTALLEKAGLPSDDDAPVIGIVSRLVEHKGFDLIRAVFDDIVNTGYKVVILGSGDLEYENFFREMQDKFPDRVSFTCGYIPAFATMIYAGADMFLMPSKQEPCGLAQMISLRYGTIPIVRATGGLKDSIIDCGDEGGTGFTFKSYDAHDMLNSIVRAYNHYNEKRSWGGLVTRALKADFSWKQSAKLYMGLYEELCN